jgi:hypothetical protein
MNDEKVKSPLVQALSIHFEKWPGVAGSHEKDKVNGKPSDNTTTSNDSTRDNKETLQDGISY